MNNNIQNIPSQEGSSQAGNALVVGKEELLTIKEIAGRMGKSEDTVRRIVEKESIKPIVDTKRTAEGTEAAVYDWSDFAKTHMIFAQKRKEQLTMQDRQEIVMETLDGLNNGQKVQLAVEAMMSVLQDLKQENDKLQVRLDEAEEWASVKRVLADCGKEYAWRPLKKYSMEHGYEIQRVYDKNYGEVNAYHTKVWEAVYGVEI